MTKFLLRDVGDGLNLLICNQHFHDLTVDYGGDENSNCHMVFRDNFMLTHFHADHYNGILNCNRNCYWHLDKFYHPRMPTFSKAKEFFMCLLAMNIRISKNHPIQNTVFDLVLSLNSKHLDFIPVSQGDTVVCGNRKYEILWPPKVLENKGTLISIGRAIRDFEEAAKNDVKLREIYDRVYAQYKDSDVNDCYGGEQPVELQAIQQVDITTELVRKANDSLRKAANRLSIAFRQDDNILFLGDLENKEINSVVSDLVHNHNTAYDILIAPHHGTHWHVSLKSISCNFCLASVGKTLRRNICYEYRCIADAFVRTDEWGDIKISNRNRINNLFNK